MSRYLLLPIKVQEFYYLLVLSSLTMGWSIFSTFSRYSLIIFSCGVKNLPIGRRNLGHLFRALIATKRSVV